MPPTQLSDEEILKLWRNPLFEASFKGSRSVQTILKTNLGADVPLSRINRVLRSDPIFLIHQRRYKKISRRNFFLSSIGQLLQADIAYMFSENEYKYFLLVLLALVSRYLISTYTGWHIQPTQYMLIGYLDKADL